jgi:hypothetical protein
MPDHDRGMHEERLATAARLPEGADSANGVVQRGHASPRLEWCMERWHLRPPPRLSKPPWLLILRVIALTGRNEQRLCVSDISKKYFKGTKLLFSLFATSARRDTSQPNIQ